MMCNPSALHREGKKNTVPASKLTFSVSASPLTWNDRYLQLQSSELQNTKIKEFISNALQEAEFRAFMFPLG